MLGILQGATEFIPVSSSGHLVLVPWALGWPNPDLAYDAVVHLGTLVAVVLAFWGDIVTLVAAWLRSVRERRIAAAEARLAWLIVVSAVPGALLGCLLGDLFESLFHSPLAVSLLLLVTGLVLFGSAYLARGRTLSEVRLRDAILIGVMQALAIAPGISRSGMTIAAGLYSGLSATRRALLVPDRVAAHRRGVGAYGARRGERRVGHRRGRRPAGGLLGRCPQRVLGHPLPAPGPQRTRPAPLCLLLLGGGRGRAGGPGARAGVTR